VRRDEGNSAATAISGRSVAIVSMSTRGDCEREWHSKNWIPTRRIYEKCYRYQFKGARTSVKRLALPRAPKNSTMRKASDIAGFLHRYCIFAV
jgi:hypothetical protein